MAVYWVSLEVHLAVPLSLVADDGTREKAELRGFVQELGCTADDEVAMRALVEAHVARYDLGPGQHVDVLFVETLTVDPDVDFEDDPDLLDALTRAPGPGVWFEGRRAFYSEEGAR
ncbi:hypothetical protein L6R52_19660 [Myxococcota bacterium]|nr:hypothetical protein [Myxococcota bacterium]